VKPDIGVLSRCPPADDPPQLGRDAVQHRALFLHPLGVIVHFAGDRRHDLLGLLARGVVEALRNPCVVEAEVAGQGRCRPAQVMGRERLEPSSSQRPAVLVLSLFVSCLVPRRASAIAFRWIGWPLYMGLSKTNC